MSTTLTTQQLADVMALLDQGRNLSGEPLRPDIRARLYAVIQDPTQKTWDNAHSILIDPTATLWQALLMYTDYDVQRGPVYLAGDRTEGQWEKVPTAEQIMFAIRTFIHWDA